MCGHATLFIFLKSNLSRCASPLFHQDCIKFLVFSSKRKYLEISFSSFSPQKPKTSFIQGGAYAVIPPRHPLWCSWFCLVLGIDLFVALAAHIPDWRAHLGSLSLFETQHFLWLVSQVGSLPSPSSRRNPWFTQQQSASSCLQALIITSGPFYSSIWCLHLPCPSCTLSSRMYREYSQSPGVQPSLNPGESAGLLQGNRAGFLKLRYICIWVSELWCSGFQHCGGIWCFQHWAGI